MGASKLARALDLLAAGMCAWQVPLFTVIVNHSCMWCIETGI